MKRKIMIIILPIIICVLAIGGLYIAVYDRERSPENPQPADCIIVLGNKVNPDGPCLSLQGRLQRALDLYTQGYAPNIIVCGGRNANEPASEASVMKAWLTERDVSDEAVYMDDISSNTKENLQQAKRIMQENSFESAIICTSDFHSYRAMRIAEDYQIKATPAKDYTVWSGKPATRVRESLSWIKYYLGL